MTSFLQDLRHGLRTLARSPGFTAVAVIVLALGIGANTAVFSVIDAVLLRPLPYPEAERLCLLRETSAELPEGSVSLPNYLDWRAGQHSFTDLALYRRLTDNVSFAPAGGEAPERIGTAQVSANLFTVLGTGPRLGRDFTEADDKPGAPPVTIIGDAFWRKHFAADPAAIGQRVTVNGVPREIVGVLPPQVRFPRSAQLISPFADQRAREMILNRGNHPGLVVLGRLKPGVTPERAGQDLNVIAAELARRYPDSNAGRSVSVKTLLDASVGSYRHNLYLLLGAVGCVLLIACANVANLQLARATGRTKELAVRAALGASRWRLVRQMLTESAVLGVLGGLVGVLLALWAMDAIIALSPTEVPRFKEARLDPAVLIFTGLVALGTGTLAGVWPAWKLSHPRSMAAALHDSAARGASGGAGQGRMRAILTVAQVALAVVLLTGAGLTLKAFYQAQNRPLGFRPQGILMMSLALPAARYDDAQAQQFYLRLLERVRALPGVRAAAMGVNVPFDDNEWDSNFHITGTPPYPPGKEPSAEMNFVSTDYFQTMGMPILRGRDFDGREVLGQPRAVIIDEKMAREYFPGKDPIGQHIDDTATMVKDPPPLTVIGVVPHTRNDAPGENDILDRMPQMHLSMQQADETGGTLTVRAVSGDPMLLAEPIRQTVLSLDAELPVAEVATMEQNIAASLTSRRLTMTLLGTFALLALGLATVGLYGVMALSVTQRTRELGIRLALGAQRRAVLGLVLREGATLVAVGLGVGLLAALGVSRLVASVLSGVGGGDAATLGGVCTVLAGAALLACWLPARRATRVDPMIALRNE